QSIPSQSAPQGLWLFPNTDNPNGNARLLNWRWGHRQAVNLEEFSGKRILLPFPKAVDVLQSLVENMCPHFNIDSLADFAKAFLFRTRSQTCRENQPAVREVVYRDAFFSQFPRTSAGYRSDHCAEANARSASGDSAHHHPRIEQFEICYGKA